MIRIFIVFLAYKQGKKCGYKEEEEEEEEEKKVIRKRIFPLLAT